MSVETNTIESSTAPRQAREQLDIEENDPTTEDNNIVYPTGFKLWMAISSFVLYQVFVGLDMTIVAVAVPSLSNHFKKLDDIGWYSASYQLIFSSLIFFSAQLYSVFSIKYTFLASMCLFELGSLLCTVAPTSATFILGRAIAGFGSSGLQTGSILCLTYCLPVHKRPFWTGIIGAAANIALVIAPLIGGVLIDLFSWRACFGINLPIGALTFALTAYGLHIPVKNPNADLPFLEKLKRLDILGTLVFVPAIVCLLIGLQWGGINPHWRVWVYSVSKERRSDPSATNHEAKKCHSWRRLQRLLQWNLGRHGVLYVNLLPRSEGLSATKSGALGLSIFGGMTITALVAGTGTTFIGYYYPFMLAGSVLTPIASGLITTIEYNENIIKVLFLLAFLGAGVGLGIQSPVMAVQTVLPEKDVATGLALTGFAGGLASSLFVSISATLFQTRLSVEMEQYAPGTSTMIFNSGGLADVRGQIGPSRLSAVLSGYDKAVVQTLYIPVALAAWLILASVAMERRSVKKRQ